MEFSDKDIRRARQIVQILQSKAFNDKAIASSKFGRHSIITGDTQFQARERGFVLVGGGAAPRGSFDEGRAIAQLFRTNRRNSAIASSFIGPPEPLTKGKISGVGTNLPAVYDPRLAAFQTARQARFRSEAEARNRSVDPIFKYRINSSVGLFHSRSKSAMDSASVFQSAGVSNLERAYESSISDLHTVPTEEEMLTRDERYERHRLAKQELNRSRRSGLRAYVYDKMGDYERTRYDLSQKYKSSSLADAKIRRDALKKLPNWMKALVGGEKAQTKTLFNLANKFGDATKVPIIGNMLKNPFALGLGALGLIISAMRRSDQANTSVVDWQNAANLSGAPSKRFSELALLAGDKDPAAIARRFGKATLKFGDAEMFYSSLAPQIKNVSPIARMAIASQLGLDETDFAIMDMMSGRITPDRTRRAMAGKNMAEQLKEVGISSGAGVFDTLEAWRLSIPGMSSAAARDYADIDYVRNKSNKNYGASMDKYIYGAIDSANTYQQTYGTGASNGTGGEKNINVNVTTGDVVLPNAQNGNDVIKGIINYSADKSDCEAVLHMFDSKTE